MRSPALFALASACVTLLVACGTAPASAPRPATKKAHPVAPHASRHQAYGHAVPNGPPYPDSQGNISVTLSVRRIPTTFAVENVRPVPASVTVSLPASWRGAIGAYWSGSVFLGPAGWTGKGVYGADGSGGVTLYPPGANPSRSSYHGPYVAITTAGACMGCGDASAAGFFAYVRQNWSQFRIIDGPAPKPVPVLSQVALSQNIVAYRLPDKGGLEVNGVAYSGLVHHASGLPFEQMNVALPAKDTALATAVLNYFLANDLTSLP